MQYAASAIAIIPTMIASRLLLRSTLAAGLSRIFSLAGECTIWMRGTPHSPHRRDHVVGEAAQVVDLLGERRVGHVVGIAEAHDDIGDAEILEHAYAVSTGDDGTGQILMRGTRSCVPANSKYPPRSSPRTMAIISSMRLPRVSQSVPVTTKSSGQVRARPRSRSAPAS